jgi:hypothetical protein
LLRRIKSGHTSIDSIEGDERTDDPNDHDTDSPGAVVREAGNTENTTSKLDVRHAIRNNPILINENGEESTIIRFFGIVEMVGMAILRLPIRDILLRAMLVCKNWKETIDTSPSIQKALFFQPVQGTKLEKWENKVDSAVTFWAEIQDDQWVYTVFVNPFYSSFHKQREADLTDCQREAIKRPEASWRRMRICQPEVVLSFSTEQSRTNRQYVNGQWTPIDHWRRTAENRLVELLDSEKNGFLIFSTFSGVTVWQEPEHGNEIGRVRRLLPFWLRNNRVKGVTTRWRW